MQHLCGDSKTLSMQRSSDRASYGRSNALSSQADEAVKLHLETAALFRVSGLTEFRPIASCLLCLDVGRADDLAPLFGLVSNKLAEVGGRT
jgi:hypothetical protein